jgi:hypothetical protein
MYLEYMSAEGLGMLQYCVDEFQFFNIPTIINLAQSCKGLQSESADGWDACVYGVR